jgi:hypothetical protein
VLVGEQCLDEGCVDLDLALVHLHTPDNDSWDISPVEHPGWRSSTLLPRDEAFAAFPDDMWPRRARATNGEEHEVSVLPFRRWRYAVLHLMDLGLGYSPADWPDELVSRCVPGLLADLPRRVDALTFVAWAMLRGPAPAIDGNDPGGWCFSADEATNQASAGR